MIVDNVGNYSSVLRNALYYLLPGRKNVLKFNISNIPGLRVQCTCMKDLGVSPYSFESGLKCYMCM